MQKYNVTMEPRWQGRVPSLGCIDDIPAAQGGTPVASVSRSGEYIVKMFDTSRGFSNHH